VSELDDNMHLTFINITVLCTFVYAHVIYITS